MRTLIAAFIMAAAPPVRRRASFPDRSVTRHWRGDPILMLGLSSCGGRRNDEDSCRWIRRKDACCRLSRPHADIRRRRGHGMMRMDSERLNGHVHDVRNDVRHVNDGGSLSRRRFRRLARFLCNGSDGESRQQQRCNDENSHARTLSSGADPFSTQDRSFRRDTAVGRADL